MGFYISIADEIFRFINGFFNYLPKNSRILVGLLLYTVFIVIYSVFIWKFYRFLSKQNIIELNLRKYNHSKNPSWEKFFVAVLDIIEYIIILPFLVVFWFVVLALFLLILSKFSNIKEILMITASIIAATRITAYISEDLSRDIAKTFPLTVLVLFLVDSKFLVIKTFFNRLEGIPKMFEDILIFLVFVFIVEIILRGLYVLVELVYSKNEEEELLSE